MSVPSTAHTAKGAVKVASASYLSNLAIVLASILIPRFLGREVYGEYAFLTSSLWLAGLSSKLGLNLIIKRHFAPLYNSGAHEKASGLYKAFFLINMAGGFLAAVSCFFFLLLASPFQFSFLVVSIVSSLVLVWNVSHSLFDLQLGVLNYGRWSILLVVNSFLRPLLVVPGYYFFGLTGAVGGLFAGEFLTLAAGFMFSSGLLSLINVRADFRLFWSHIRLALLAGANQLADNIRRYLGVMMVAFFTLYPDFTGFFEIALRAVVLMSSAVFITSSALMPSFSILHEQTDSSRLLDWIDLISRGGLFVLILIGGAFAIVGKVLIIVLIGNAFEPVYQLVVILSLSLPFRWIEMMCDRLCEVHQRPELNIPARVAWLLSFFLFGILALERWGVPGLAVVFCFSSVLSCGLSCLIVFKKIDVSLVTMKIISLFLCVIPFSVLLPWSDRPLRILLALGCAVAAAFVIAQISGALRINEIGKLYRAVQFKSN